MKKTKKTSYDMDSFPLLYRMRTQLIALKDILPDTTYQFRETSVGKNVAELCRLISDGIELDPVVLWEIPRGYLILDGFQRVEATRKVKGEGAEIRSVVKKMHENCENIALDIAIAANQKHGATLERADRKKMAIRLLKENPEEYDTVIAKKVGLSPRTIANYREEVDGARISTRRDKKGRQVKVRQPDDKKKAEVDTSTESESDSPAEQNTLIANQDPTEEKSDFKGEEVSEVIGPISKVPSVIKHSDANKNDVSDSDIDAESIDPALSVLHGHLNDVSENIDQMAHFVEAQIFEKNRGEVESDLLEAIMEAVDGLMLWNSKTFPED